LIGDDIGGIAVHTAARVAAKAQASEVWVSRTVKDLVAGSGLEFTERGAFELKEFRVRGRCSWLTEVAWRRPRKRSDG
jgi:class 3 adenylate cyclase